MSAEVRRSGRQGKQPREKLWKSEKCLAMFELRCLGVSCLSFALKIRSHKYKKALLPTELGP